MDIKDKIRLKKAILILLSAVVGTETSYQKEMKKCKNESGTIEVVTSDFRRELYNDRLLSYHFSCDEKNDKYITSGLLKEIFKLSLDMSLNEDLSILEKCPNLQNLTINSAELLNDEDIDFINNSSVSNLTLIFGLNNVNKLREDKFDMSRFKGLNIVIKRTSANELLNLIFINYLENYDLEMLDFDFNKYKTLDDIINSIIAEFNLNSDLSDEEKILFISNYILKKIEYDEEIYEYLSLDPDEITEQLKDNYETKTQDYNKNSISSIVLKDGINIEGICANYSALLDIICYKMNIKSRIVIGKNNSKDVYHGWNVVFIDDIMKYIDLTYLDSSYNKDLKDLLDNYCRYQSVEDFNILKDYIFESIYFSHANYELKDNLSEIDKVTKANIEYYNEKLEGNLFYPKASLISSIDEGIFCAILSYMIIKIFNLVNEDREANLIKKKKKR